MAIKLIYGLPGMGKTTLMHDLIREQAAVTKWFIVDHANEWSDPEAIHWRGSAPELTVIEYGKTPPEEWPEAGVFVFQGWDGDQVAELALRVGDCEFVDDEIDLVGRRKGWETSALRHIVHRGRHIVAEDGSITEVGILGACRRPQNLATDLTDLAAEVCIFRVQGNRTLQRLQADSMIEDDDWERVRTLPKFEFLHWPTPDDKSPDSRWMAIHPIGTDSSAPGNKRSDGK